MFNNVLIKKFIEKLNTNAPLTDIKSNNDYTKNKYPYKPILILSIFTQINDVDQLFNKDININDDHIIKTYYDLLMNSETMYNFLINQKSKQRWFLIYNNKTKSSILSNMFSMPIKWLQVDGFFSFNQKNKTVKFSINLPIDQLKKLKDYLIDEAYKTLIKCVDDYKDLNLKEIINYEDYINTLMITTNDLDSKINRTYQHIFRKEILNRDKKCKICCLDLEDLLEACHIKPYACCTNEIEKYNQNNGITLCRNHHKLFDCGYFSFNDDWTICISKSIPNNLIDYDLLLKKYEPCYLEELKLMSNNNEFVKFHKNHIFIK